MPTISSGSVIRRLGANNEPGVAGCLVQFPGDPEKLFWLTAGHVLLSSTAEQFDRMEAKDLPGETIGMLFGWTSLDGQVTVDAALVWVNPKLVSPETQGFIAPTDINPLPDIGDKLHLFVKGQEHVGVIEDNGAPVSITVTGQDFNQEFTFQGQITCTGFETLDCDGAIAVDENNLVVGMVVGRGVMVGLGERTVVTPIEGILKHPDWGPGEPLQLVTAVPPTAIAPLVPAPKPV